MALDIMERLPRNLPIIENMPLEILERCVLITYNKGDIIFSKGDEAQYVYHVCGGRIGVFNEMSDGRAERVVWVMPYESIGEMEVLAGENHIVFSAKVYEDGTLLLRIMKEDYLDMLKKDRKYCFEAACTVAKKLYIASDTFCHRNTESALVRINRFLLDICRKLIEREGLVVLRNSRSEIADNCGLSERTVNRCIKKLKEQNLLSICKGKIMISKEQYENLRVNAEAEEK